MFISYVISSPALLPIRGQLCQDGLLLVSRVNDEETDVLSPSPLGSPRGRPALCRNKHNVHHVTSQQLMMLLVLDSNIM